MAIFTISRQMGSLGGEIAGEVARRLNAPLLDSANILAEAARLGLAAQQKTPPEMAERPPTLLERLGEDRARYGVLVRSVVYDFALNQEPTVIVGLSGQILFAPVRQALRALTIAPFEARVERVKAAAHVDDETARATVHRSDRERAGYYHLHAPRRLAERRSV